MPDAAARGPTSRTATQQSLPGLSPPRASPTTESAVPSSAVGPHVSGPDWHQLQLRYKLAPPTFRSLCSTPRSPDRRQVLQRACLATEFLSLPMRQDERPFFRYINDNTAIPYPVAEHIAQPWHKVFLLVQIDLQGAGWPNKLSAQTRKLLLQDRGRLYLVLDRALRCLVDILGKWGDGRGVTVALDVLRSVKAGVWEGSERELLQIDGIGPVKMEKLVRAGIKNIGHLSNLEFYHIERLLSRNPPFGHQLLHQLQGFPALVLHFQLIPNGSLLSPPAARRRGGPEVEIRPGPSALGTDPRQGLHMARITLAYRNQQLPRWNQKTPWVTLVVEGDAGRLVWFWRGCIRRLTGQKELVVGMELRKGEQLKVTLACEEIVGTMIRDTCQVP